MADNLEQTPVSVSLTQMGIPHEEFRHISEIRSLEQAAEERNQSREQIIRSILFRLGEGEFVMVLMPGGSQVSWRNLRQFLGRSRVSMASTNEVIQVTGYDLGAVSPFGLPTPLRILVDEGICKFENISLGSGVRNIAIMMRCDDLLRALGEYEMGPLCECD
jgi:Cys-tRNA(Pro) deacylase